METTCRLKHKEVFSFIRQHNLFSSIDDKIMLLMDFDLDKALELLINNIQVIKVSEAYQHICESCCISSFFSSYIMFVHSMYSAILYKRLLTSRLVWKWWSWEILSGSLG